MKRSFKHFLEDALEYCEKAQKFVEDMTFKEFEQDEKTFLAVTRALEIIGEALKNIPDEFKNKYGVIFIFFIPFFFLNCGLLCFKNSKNRICCPWYYLLQNCYKDNHLLFYNGVVNVSPFILYYSPV